jgi:hypothetical protein
MTLVTGNQTTSSNIDTRCHNEVFCDSDGNDADNACRAPVQEAVEERSDSRCASFMTPVPPPAAMMTNITRPHSRTNLSPARSMSRVAPSPLKDDVADASCIERAKSVHSEESMLIPAVQRYFLSSASSSQTSPPILPPPQLDTQLSNRRPVPPPPPPVPPSPAPSYLPPSTQSVEASCDPLSGSTANPQIHPNTHPHHNAATPRATPPSLKSKDPIVIGPEQVEISASTCSSSLRGESMNKRLVGDMEVDCF